MQIIATESGLRIDSFLAEQVPELTRSAVQKLLESGHITCGLRKNRKLRKVLLVLVILAAVAAAACVALGVI